MRKCLITSFARSHGHGDVPIYSAAVYQPKGYSYQKAEWADIRDEYGKWIRPREFVGPDYDEPLLYYHQALLNHYSKRKREIDLWLSWQGTEFILCCWCPHERAAKRQLAEHGTYVCHTSVIGEHLELHHGVQVFYDHDRRLMKVLP